MMRFIFIIVLLLMSFASHAVDYSGCGTNAQVATCRTIDEAVRDVDRLVLPAGQGKVRCVNHYANGKWFWGSNMLPAGTQCGPWENTLYGGVKRYYVDKCPPDKIYSEKYKACLKQCFPPEWSDPTDFNNCLDEHKCRARNAGLDGGIGNAGVGVLTPTCKGGCDFRPDRKLGIVGGDMFGGRYAGTWNYSGLECGADPPEPPPDPKNEPECQPLQGQTACLKPNGDVCYSTGGSVSSFCWRPGETGEKSGGNEQQTRTPGTQQQPATKEMPNGDTVNKVNDATSTVTYTTNISTTTIVTTTTNYQTASGADAAPGKPDQRSNPNDGDGDEEDEGDGDGQQGTHSGDCSAPPVCSIPGTIECAQLLQTWSNHCNAAENHNGPDPLAAITDQPINAESGLFQDGDSPDTIFQNAPSGGWAGRGACPVDVQFDTPIGNFVMTPDLFCSFLDAFAALVLIIGALHFTMIIGRGIS